MIFQPDFDLKMKAVVITGASKGIGLATTDLFLNEGWSVSGIDIVDSPYAGRIGYDHYICDVRKKDRLPFIPNVGVLINNAGVQMSDDDIGVNLKGTINCTERYMSPDLRSVVNLASVSAHNGAEFPEYCASKGGVLSYTINTAKRMAPYGICNSLSFGGVATELNQPVMDDKLLWKEIMDLTPMAKWMTPEECAEWIYFVAVINKSMTGQDIIIDNGETRNAHFVWPVI